MEEQTIPTSEGNLTIQHTTSTTDVAPPINKLKVSSTSIEQGSPSPQKESFDSSLFNKIAAQNRVQERISNIQKKYSSIHSMQKADKIAAVKNPNLNPVMLLDASSPENMKATAPDMLAASMEKWKNVAYNISKGHYLPEEKNKIAGSFYDKMIAPAYAAMGKRGLSKEEFLGEAFGEALNFDASQVYDSSLMHMFRQGGSSGVAQLGRALDYMSTLLGDSIHQMKGRFAPWQDQIQNPPSINILSPAKMKEDMKGDSLFLDKAADFFHDGARGNQFWADALPNRNWVESALSYIPEMAAQLPIFAATEGMGSVIGEGTNLTKILSATPKGKAVLPYLMAGTEGLAYGTLTREETDKAKAWQDAVGFMVFHGLFKAGEAGVVKASDMLKGSARKAADKEAERLALAQEGKRPATAEEVYEQHKKQVANNLAVGGIETQNAINRHAILHILAHEKNGSTAEFMDSHAKQMLEEDPASAAPMLSAVKFIQDAIGDKKLSELEPEEKKALTDKLTKLTMDAASEMHTHVPQMQEAAAKEATATVSKIKGTRSLDFFRAQTVRTLTAKGLATSMKPEEIEKLAVQRFEQAQARAAQKAEEAIGDKGVRKAKQAVDIEKKIYHGGDAQYAGKVNKARAMKAWAERQKILENPGLKIRSERTVDKYGQPAVRFQVTPDWKVYIGKVAQKAGVSTSSKDFSQYLSKWFENLSDEDFSKDLTDLVYPKALKDANVFFEHEHTPEGNQSPNFYAFMYNYLDKMPKEMGKELENRFAESMKVQKFMNGRKPSEPQLMYYAKQMYNHVDTFLASGRWPKESNIFRSTQANMWQPTKWQRQLLIERQITEKKILQKMFGNRTKAFRNAWDVYKPLMDARLKAFDLAHRDFSSPTQFQDANKGITDLLTSTGKREEIKF